MRKALLLLMIAAMACRSEPTPQASPTTGTTMSETVAEAAAPETATVASPPTQTATAPPPDPAPASTDTQSGAKNVFIDAVAVANPLVVEGRARTFENAVTVRALDARGRLLSDDHVTAVGEMGNFNPYRATLWLTRDPGGPVTVEALEHSAEDGSVRSRAAKQIDTKIEGIEAVLYVPVECEKVQRVTRRLPKSVSLARLLVETLMAEPKSPFPQGSGVRSINLKGGVVTVDFNERLQNVGGACAAQAIRASVTKTLEELPNVDKVVITAGGSERLALQP